MAPWIEPRAVVEGHDADALGQSRLKFPDLVLDALGDFQRVLAVPHHDNRADRFGAVFLQHAAAELAAAADAAELRDADRRAVRRVRS